MITVIVVVIVVLIFCCIIPFYRALEKRYHHWEDTEHDPRLVKEIEPFSWKTTYPKIPYGITGLHPKKNVLKSNNRQTDFFAYTFVWFGFLSRESCSSLK